LPLKDNNPMSRGDKLELQRRAAANTEQEQANESGENRDHGARQMAVVPEIRWFTGLSGDGSIFVFAGAMPRAGHKS
jgi:hypothetical protein